MRIETGNTKQQQPRNAYALYFWVLGGLVVLGIVGALFSPRREEIPSELQGVWKTTDSAHSDRFIEISPVTVCFGTGSGTVSTGFIQKFEKVSEGRETLYSVTYTSDDGERKLWFTYEPTSRVLRLKNQQSVRWLKSKNS